MGPLGTLFSAIDTTKRKLGDLFSSPVQSAQQMVGYANDRARGLNELTSGAAQEMKQGLLSGGSTYGPKSQQLTQTIADAYNPMGMVVWHGSPHKFSKFDSSKIGAGEGSQAYGYGHYVAESPDVARSYSVMAQKPARRQAGVSSVGKDQAVIDSLIRLNAKQYTGGNVAELAELIKSRPAAFTNPDGMIARASEYIDNLPPSYMYKIDLPDEHVAKMIDLENAVPESIRSPLSQKALDEFGSGFSLGDGTSLLKQLEFEFKSKGSRHPAKDAANWLRQQGVPGLKFKDAGTRNMADGGTSNFVVFPGNEHLLQILERNGQLLK